MKQAASAAMETNPPTGVATGPEVIDRGVLEIVSALVKELRGGTSPVPVALGSSLEPDLGIEDRRY